MSLNFGDKSANHQISRTFQWGCTEFVDFEDLWPFNDVETLFAKEDYQTSIYFQIRCNLSSNEVNRKVEIVDLVGC